MPVDEERKKRIAFGPDYVQGESTYMVTAAPAAKTVEESTGRHAGDRHRQHDHDPRRRPHAEEHDDLAGDLGRRRRRGDARRQGGRVRALARLAADLCQAGAGLAHGRRRVPADRIAIAVAKGKPAALAAVTEFIDEAKKDGRCAACSTRTG
jgi:polar amino acid transport system substrate-binding protein